MFQFSCKFAFIINFSSFKPDTSLHCIKGALALFVLVSFSGYVC